MTMIDDFAVENAVRRARAAWDAYSRLRRSSCRTGDPAAACTAWARVDSALAELERLSAGSGARRRQRRYGWDLMDVAAGGRPRPR